MILCLLKLTGSGFLHCLPGKRAEAPFRWLRRKGRGETGEKRKEKRRIICWCNLSMGTWYYFTGSGNSMLLPLRGGWQRLKEQRSALGERGFAVSLPGSPTDPSGAGSLALEGGNGKVSPGEPWHPQGYRPISSTGTF